MNKNFFFTSLNKNYNGIPDSWGRANFIDRGGFKYFGNKVHSVSECDFIVYYRSHKPGFVFDTELADTILKLDKKIIIFDYAEYPVELNSDYLFSYDILGYKTTDVLLKCLKDCTNSAYDLINYFFKFKDKNLICCYFKRELSKFINLDNVEFPVYPVDYFTDCSDLLLDTGTEKQFHRRPIKLFYNWGRSGADRANLQGALISNTNKFPDVLMSEAQLNCYLDKNQQPLIFAGRCEKYERMDYKKYLPITKAVADLYGLGMKCIRNAESACCTASFKQDPSMILHAYPWKDGVNCIYLPNKSNNKLDIDSSIDIIYDHTIGGKQHRLFEILAESQNTARKYLNRTYTHDYIMPKLQKFLL